MSDRGRERVRSMLGGPAYRKVFAAVRCRVEEGGQGARSLSLAGLDAAERRALADLLGWEVLPEGTVRLDLPQLEVVLQESAAGASLREVLEALGGPLRDRQAARRAERDAREAMWAEARRALGDAGRTELLTWLDGLRSGALARAARAGRADEATLLSTAVRAALRIPSSGQLLSVFAASAAGDPHALDAGAPLGGLVLRAAAALAGRAQVPTSAPERRRLWREVGIDCDSLSADVLVLGLRPGGKGLLARQLRESAEAGEPRRVTLRELEGAELPFEDARPVLVCENPAVVEAAADVAGGRSAALVCVEGVPSTAALELLRRASAAGARVRVHGDFDWAGLRIAGQVIAETGGEPWRFSAADYEAAVASGAAGPALAGRPAPSPWDERLTVAMAREGVAVPEERVIAALVGDLAW